MKYAVILPDGAADLPLEQLDWRTPLEAARIPNMDWVASRGRLGLSRTIPAGFTPATDVGTLSLFGYDPHKFYSGRAPIEAAARRLSAAADELIFRCNFVTIADQRMRDFAAGHITQAEAERLIADLNGLVEKDEPALRGCKFHAGVSYRNLLFVSDADDIVVECAPPHDIPNELVADRLPRGAGQERIRGVMRRAADMLGDHELNRVRRKQERPQISDIWLWGQGKPVALEPFSKRFGLSGAVITGVDIIRGLALSMGMELIEVPGATGYLDTNYAGKGAAAAAALDEFDLVSVHVEASDEAGHLGDAGEKIKALERTDEQVLGPLLEALRRHDQWRILIAPDHPTPCATTAHDASPPPFCFAGKGIDAAGRRTFSEKEAAAAGWMIDPGHELMTHFILD